MTMRRARGSHLSLPSHTLSWEHHALAQSRASHRKRTEVSQRLPQEFRHTFPRHLCILVAPYAGSVPGIANTKGRLIAELTWPRQTPNNVHLAE